MIEWSFMPLSTVFQSHHGNSSPNGKTLDWSKLKAFADDEIDLNKKSKIVLGRVENIMGKAENADYQHFLLF